MHLSFFKNASILYLNYQKVCRSNGVESILAKWSLALILLELMALAQRTQFNEFKLSDCLR